MTTEMTNVPQHIQDRISARKLANTRSALLDAVAGESFPRISTRASRYRLVDDGLETVIGTELDVVFVAVNPKVSRAYYEGAFDPDAKAPPTCSSSDGVTPDTNIAKPQNDNCAKCPNNVLGSKMLPSGEKGKLCGSTRLTAVVSSADPSKVYGLGVSLMAMKGLREYFKGLSNYGMIPEEVVTTLGFDDKASYPLITFKHKAYVPAKLLDRIAALGTEPETLKIIRVGEQQARLAAPAAQPAITAPAKPDLKVVPTPPTAPAVEDNPVVDETSAEETGEQKLARVQAELDAVKKANAAAKKTTVKDKPPAAAAPAAATDAAITALESQLGELFGAPV